MGGFHNARDLGGLPTTDGGVTRCRALIRSADLRFVTAAGWRSAVDAGVRTVIDLRNDDEVAGGSFAGATSTTESLCVQPAAGPPIRPEEVQALRVPIDDTGDVGFWKQLDEKQMSGTPLYYRPFIEAKPRRCAAAVAAIAQAQPGGIIFHCGAGCHRTGLVTLLVLCLAGVTPDAIAEDYELSDGQTGPLRAALGIMNEEPSTQAMLRRHGTTARAVILDALDGLDVAQRLGTAGLSEADILSLRGRLRGYRLI